MGVQADIGTPCVYDRHHICHRYVYVSIKRMGSWSGDIIIISQMTPARYYLLWPRYHHITTSQPMQSRPSAIASVMTVSPVPSCDCFFVLTTLLGAPAAVVRLVVLVVLGTTATGTGVGRVGTTPTVVTVEAFLSGKSGVSRVGWEVEELLESCACVTLLVANQCVEFELSSV